MICIVNLKSNGEVCSNTRISGFEGDISRNYTGETQPFLSVQYQINSLGVS